MERNFYTNDFEELLKENADQFKLSPSKKVWRGIYNDIHPGKRWPSIAMSLIFVFTLVLVGHLNNRQSQNYLSGVQKNVELQNDKKEVGAITVQQPINNKIFQKNTSQPGTSIIYAKIDENISGENLIANNKYSAKKRGVVKKIVPVSKQGDNKDLLVNNNFPDLQDIYTNQPDRINLYTKEKFISSLNADIPTALISFELPNFENEIIKNSETDKGINSVNSQPENKVPVSPQIKIRRNPRINWAYYISPTLSYRTYLNQNNKEDQTYLRSINSSSNIGASSNRAIIHRPALGVEAGVALKYSLTQKLKITSGFQVNYSAYKIQANNVHPILSTLVLRNENTGMPYAASSISYFGNGPGSVPVNLHNYSLQLSIPIGLEYQIAGNEKIQFSAFGTFQPSLVLTNSAYLLSTDKRNYVMQPSLSRRWNVGTNIGTLISFNSNKLKWQIGPQVRYQFLSSYLNKYQVKEHFIDYGVRLGVSKIIK